LPLAFVVLLTILTHVAYAGARVAVSLFALQLGAKPAAVGTLGALFAVLPMIFSVGAGRTIDRIGFFKPMLAGAVAVSLGAALAFFWPVLSALYIVSPVIGSGLMLFHIAANNAVGAIGEPADRTRNFNFLALGFSVSGFLGPLIAGLAIDELGHPAAFLVLALCPALAAVALSSRRVSLPRLPVAPHRIERRLMDLLRVRPLRDVLLVSALFSMAWETFAFVMPIYGASVGLSATTIGTILGAFALATFTVRLALPALSRRLREWRLVAVALAIGCAIFLGFPFFELAPVLLALAFVLGLGLGMSQPMVMSLLYSAAPAGRVGEAVGIRTSLVNFSQTAMPLFFGGLGSVLGVAPVFWAMALALGVGAAWAHGRR
jgi:MFS family permease